MKHSLNYNQPFQTEFIINRNPQTYQTKFSRLFQRELLIQQDKSVNFKKLLHLNTKNTPLFYRKYNKNMSLQEQIQYLVQKQVFQEQYTKEIINKLIVRDNIIKIGQHPKQALYFCQYYTNYIIQTQQKFNLRDYFSELVQQMQIIKTLFLSYEFITKLANNQDIIVLNYLKNSLVYKESIEQSLEQFFYHYYLGQVANQINIKLTSLQQSQFHVKFYKRQFIILLQHFLQNIFKIILINKYIQETETALQSAYLINQCNLQISKFEQELLLLKEKLIQIEEEIENKTIHLNENQKKQVETENLVQQLLEQFRVKQQSYQRIQISNEIKCMLNEELISKLQFEYDKINPYVENIQQQVNNEQQRRDGLKEQVLKKKNQMENVQKEAALIKQQYQEKMGQIYSQEQQIVQDEQRFQKISEKDGQCFQKKAEQVFQKVTQQVEQKILSFTQLKLNSISIDFQTSYQDLKTVYQNINLQIENFIPSTPYIEQKQKQHEYIKSSTDVKFAVLSSNIQKLSMIVQQAQKHINIILNEQDQKRLFQQERLETLQNQLEFHKKEQIEIKGIVDAQANSEIRWRLKIDQKGLFTQNTNPFDDSSHINKQVSLPLPIQVDDQFSEKLTVYQKMQVSKYGNFDIILDILFDIKYEDHMEEEFLSFKPNIYD